MNRKNSQQNILITKKRNNMIKQIRLTNMIKQIRLVNMIKQIRLTNMIHLGNDHFFKKNDLQFSSTYKTVKIPKLIFQTSKDKLPDYVVELIKSKSQDWVYNHFTDKDIIEFFKSNYLDEFPNILDVFNNIKKGQHKSDLFRYYYLYINGGVYIDSDAMIYTNMNDIVKDYDFFSVYSTINPYSIFQGFIGCTPRNPIIYSALKDVYHINKEELNNNYHALCSNLFSILKTDITNNTKFYLYYEDERHKDYAHVIDKNDPTKIILIHYYKDKIIPK